ncbi:MAG TPA: dihydroxy-acid dehydratase [Steroidobacteraceae bacterium]|jgi:dihydroxy-acid dehydratase|nr:dihydroxy-acid dehydratase [Steroidobacteraceae bacterium]
MAKLRSLAANSPFRRAEWAALGISRADMEKPKIAVVNSSSELAACFAHLDGVAKVVKETIRAAGGLPFEVRTTAPSDFIVGAANGGSYILAGRDLVTNDIEAQVGAAVLDGMVCLTSCDKTPPGHLMAAARLNIPTLLVIGGYQPSGAIGADRIDIEDVFEATIGRRFGTPLKHSIEDMAEQAIRGPGVCAGMATANTMHCVVEALGMCLPGSAPVRANSERMFDAARRSGTRIVEMVHEQLLPRTVMDERAFRNAVALVLAVSGSINSIKHLQAVASEARGGVDVFALWDEIGRKVPVLSAIRPNGERRIEEFEDAGGAAATLKQLAPLIEPQALTCTGHTLAQNIADMPVRDPEVIRPLGRPVSQGPSIAILKGTLAPESAVVKLGIRDGSRPETFTGPARVYETGEVAIQALADGKVKSGEVVVLRGQGLKGGPAMGGGASSVLFALDAAGLARSVAFVTDGQLSGLCLKGLTIAEVAPEAAVGGPIGRVRDGDVIHIDVAARKLALEVDPAELARRPVPSGYAIPASGWLGLYRREVQPMATGAILGLVEPREGPREGPRQIPRETPEAR